MVNERQVSRPFPDSLLFILMGKLYSLDLTSRSCMRNGKGRQTVRGIGRGAADTRASKGNKRYNTGNRAGYSATLDAAGMAHFFMM